MRQVPKTLKRAFTMVELIIVILVVGILALIALPKVKEDRLYEAVDQIVALIRYTQQLAIQDNLYNPNDPNWFKKRWGIQLANCQEAQNQFGLVELPFGLTVFKETNPGGTPRPIFAKDPSNPNVFLYSGYAFEHSSSRQLPCDLSKFNNKLNFVRKGVIHVYIGGFAANPVDSISITGMLNGTSLGNVSPSRLNCINNPYTSRTLSFDEFGRPHISHVLQRSYGGRVVHCGQTNAQAEGAGYMYKRFKFTISGRKQEANIYIEGDTGFVHVRYKDKDYTYRFIPYEWDAEGY
ncbi:type II secretion system protein [uncultured Campylobacter sp.]|uniref:pilus assembly FimT family protein n=1 Tax=uncultured Campylobacter sp. TaxID=218934 RepID=UPI0025E97270|nr:type II secretion system protein [uncultured Campylobacter sp.]